MLEPAKLEAKLREIQLPFQPQVLAAVLQLRDDTRMDFIEPDRLIRSDQTIASLILKLANSSFYSRGNEIRTLPQAIGMIGFRTIVSIVTAASAKNIFLSGNYAKFRRYVWQHSLVTAVKVWRSSTTHWQLSWPALKSRIISRESMSTPR